MFKLFNVFIKKELKQISALNIKCAALETQNRDLQYVKEDLNFLINGLNEYIDYQKTKIQVYEKEIQNCYSKKDFKK